MACVGYPNLASGVVMTKSQAETSAQPPASAAPETAAMVMAETWAHDYPREAAAFPLPELKRQKYWSPVGRVDNVHGDRNLFCSCVPMSEYGEA